MDRRYRPMGVPSSPFGSLQPAPMMTMADGRQLTYEQALRMMAAQQQQQQSQGPNIEQIGSDFIKGQVQREAQKELGSQVSSLFGSGSSSAGSELVSSNIPASYLPSVGSKAPEIIGMNMDKTPIYATDSVGSTIGQSGAEALGSNISSGLSSLGVGTETAAALGSGLGYAIPIAGAAYGTYKISDSLIKGKKMGTMNGAMTGAGTGAAIGSIVPGVGTLIGAGVGALAGGVLGQFGHGPNYYEGEDRKNFAKDLNKKQGKEVLNSEIFDNDVGSWSYDLNSAGKNRELGAAQGLAYLSGAGPVGSKMFTDLSARFANDVKAGKDPTQMYADMGLDYNKAMQALGSDKNLSAADRAALQNGLNDSIKPGAGMIPRANPTPNQNGTKIGQAPLNIAGGQMQNSNMIPKAPGLQPGQKMANGKTYMSPGVYR